MLVYLLFFIKNLNIKFCKIKYSSSLIYYLFIFRFRFYEFILFIWLYYELEIFYWKRI